MKKKTITLKLDSASKIILLILGAGVWVMALKPIGYSEAQAAGSEELVTLIQIETWTKNTYQELSEMNAWLKRPRFNLSTSDNDTPFDIPNNIHESPQKWNPYNSTKQNNPAKPNTPAAQKED